MFPLKSNKNFYKNMTQIKGQSLKKGHLIDMYKFNVKILPFREKC